MLQSVPQQVASLPGASRGVGMHPRTRFAFLLAAPALLVVAAVYLYPAVLTLVFSVAEVDLATFAVDRYVGFQHYWMVLSEPTLRAVAGRTVYFGGLVSLLTLVLGFAIALLLSRPFVGRGLLRVVVLLPWAVPPVVSGVLWGQIYAAEYGFLNGFLRVLGGEGRTIWLGEPTQALHALIVAEAWRALPLSALFLLAGLQTLPDGIYEAAAIDGASVWRRFRDMTLPLMMPIVLPVLIFQFVSATKAFDVIYVLTRGGPGNGTTTLNYLVYQQAFERLEFGPAAATAYTLTILTLLVIGIFAFLRWRIGVRSGEVSR
jgi:multiple sugar transport system permease protein